jgi:hypothetical protein
MSFANLAMIRARRQLVRVCLLTKVIVLPRAEAYRPVLMSWMTHTTKRKSTDRFEKAKTTCSAAYMQVSERTVSTVCYLTCGKILMAQPL